MEKNHSKLETHTCEQIKLPKNLNVAEDTQNPLKSSRSPIKKSATPTPQLGIENLNENKSGSSILTKTQKTKIDEKDTASFMRQFFSVLPFLISSF